MDLSSSNLIRPLGIAENHFLEVLVSKFSLHRQGQGSELKVSFNENTPTIWTREAKYDVQQMMPNFQHKASRYQKELDAFLLESKGTVYPFNDNEFVFRYASGGTLPVLRIYEREEKREKEYYCLFYRDIFPIGWNIANGGCDTRNELVNPVDAMERELREELIIVDVKNKKRYVFGGDAGKPLDHPTFAVARRFWQERFSWLDFKQLEELPITLKWLDGPDCLTVQVAKDDPRVITGCFLNINAEDYGIEIDKIAKINLDDDVIFLDGEIIKDRLVNAVVGLFECDRLNREVSADKTDYFPDYFFYNATSYKGKDIQDVIRKHFIPDIDKVRTAQEKHYYASCQRKFNLCPVTSRIIKRYLSLQTEVTIEPGPFDTFISFGGEDVKPAQKVFQFLRQKGKRPFFSKETIGDPLFHRAVDDALDAAQCLVAVGTKLENLQRPWVEYEFRAFHLDILNGRKPQAKLVPFISGLEPIYLPLPLRLYQAVEFEENNFAIGLQQLVKHVP